MKAAIVEQLKDNKVELWNPPYSPPESDALQQLAASYAPRVGGDEADVLAVLEEIRQSAFEKKLKTRVTLVGRVFGGPTNQKELKLEFKEKEKGAVVREELRKQLQCARLRVIAGGKNLQDEQTLAEQGWQCDATRKGEPLKVMMVATGKAAAVDVSTPSVTPATATPAAAAAKSATPGIVERVRDAVEELAASGGVNRFDLTHKSKSVPLDLDTRKNLVTAIALHARGRAYLVSEGIGAASNALEFLAEADQCFERCPAELLMQISNYGQLQLDMCWAYALLGDMAYLPDAETRLVRGEAVIRRQVDRMYLDKAEEYARLGRTITPEALPYTRWLLLRGITRRLRGDPDAEKDLERAQIFLQALNVDEERVKCLIEAGRASRVQAVAALRRAEGSSEKALDALLKQNAGKRFQAIPAQPSAGYPVVAVQEASFPEDSKRWYVQMPFAWIVFEPKVPFNGTADEEIQYSINGVKYRATFSNQDFGYQVNLKTKTSRNLQRCGRNDRIAIQAEANRLIERELGACLDRRDMEDDVAGSSLSSEMMLLNQYLPNASREA